MKMLDYCIIAHFPMNRCNGLYQINDKKIKETIDIAGFTKNIDYITKF